MKNSITKDEVINSYRTLVHKIALHLHSRLPDCILLDDLIQAGMIGLLDAYNKFDKNRDASFSTYASFRIRGSMLDEVRKNDWTPRSVAKKLRDISSAIANVEAKTGKTATALQIANELNLTKQQYYEALDDVQGSQVCSLEQIIEENTDSQFEIPTDNTNIAAQHERAQLLKTLAKHIGNLPERERLIIALYYQEEFNFKQIAQTLGISESRISQIHSQAISRLRAYLT